jgi:enoyl-CoA hydratase/carnithine racemase
MSAAPRPETVTEPPALLRQDLDSVALLTLNRPAARNALSSALIDDLALTLDAVAADRSVKAVVITAAPGPAFSSGHDLKELTRLRQDPDRGRAAFAGILSRCSVMMQKIVRLPQPVVAAVEGVATAAGCQLVASADLAVAGSHAHFCTPGVSIGLFCSTPMVALSRNLSRKHAMEMLLTGDMIGAERAAAMGLVNRVVEAGTALDEAMALARSIAARSAVTVTIGKRAFYEQAEMPLAEAYEHATRVMVENMMARDAEEGIGAFVEKRPPRWEA